MFRPKRSRADSAELEIIYEVQWKTPGNGDDKARIIGILDTPDTNLDWNTFKSYLIQSSGNMHLSTNDIKISYIDSDDDLIPVDSEMEFSECLKFSRGRARHGKKILMKVSMNSKGGARPKEQVKFRSNDLDYKPKLFCLKKKETAKKKTYSFSSDKDTGSDIESKNEMPKWFENYMSNFKAELVKEITETVTGNVKAMIGGTHARRSAPPEPTGKYHLHHVLEKRKKKKKISEEDSSDCTDGLQHWEEKMDFLRHMQKLSKREKKFEKKLDAKLEKLETKTKKIMEKKNLGLFGEGKLSQDVRKHRALLTPNVYVPTNNPAPEPVMDACGPLGEYNYTPRVAKGEVVTHGWKVMNNGQLAWTDETELRFAWGSESLVPLSTSVKCPPLQPGETGKVKVKLRAPTYAGSFESYWHFHHAGRRFGHWLGVSLVVVDDGDKEIGQGETEVELGGGPLQHSPVDLTVRQDPQIAIDSVTQAVANMTVYGVPDEWKHSEVPINLDEGRDILASAPLEETNVKDEYYSDSDNLSVISGTVSVDTDGTEPSEEFVVIPMPQCFSCDQTQAPLPVMQPISVEIPQSQCSTSPTAPESDNNNNMELKPFPEIPMCIPVIWNPETPATPEPATVTDDEDPNNVYVRDASGRAIPVAKVLKPPPPADRGEQQQPSPPFQPPPFSHSTFGDPNVGHGPNGPRFPCGATFFYEGSVLAQAGAPPPQCHNPGASANFRPQHDYSSPPPPPKGEMFCGHPCQQPSVPLVAAECRCRQNAAAAAAASVNGSVSSATSTNSDGGWSSSHHIHTEQPRAACPNRIPGAPHLQRGQSRVPREQSPVAAAVQILPETLVTGAVNVASSAINTARSVIDMLRPRHDDVVTGHWPLAASAPQHQPAPSPLDDSLRTLAEMGFNDRELNVTLLKRHDNDVARVISDLIH